MSFIESVAMKFATKVHGDIGQVRKYTGEPYITHPAAVVEIVRSVDHTEQMLAAAWLHDTVEDTETTFCVLEHIFGPEITSLVEMLTDVSHAHDGLRTHRKAIDRAHTAKASPDGQTIKLADLIHNSSSILKHDPRFAKIYLEEKRLLLEVLTDGDPILWARAKKIVDEADD